MKSIYYKYYELLIHKYHEFLGSAPYVILQPNLKKYINLRHKKDKQSGILRDS